MKKIKNYLLTGLLVWLPIGITVWIINVLLHFIDQIIPQKLTSQIIGFHFPGFGLIILLLIFVITGIIAKNFLGQSLINFSNKIILNIPIVKTIYKGIKQVSDTLLATNSTAFRKALLVKFPHQDTWTIAFITGTPNANIITTDVNNEYINVYIPTTPNPTSGYFIICKKSDTKELDLTVDQALRYVISMGSVNPVNTLRNTNAKN